MFRGRTNDSLIRNTTAASDFEEQNTLAFLPKSPSYPAHKHEHTPRPAPVERATEQTITGGKVHH